MAAKPLRTKPKSASAERCLRALGATRDMATPDMETSNCACEGCIVAWRFTKRQPGGRGDYWGLSLSGNCWFQQQVVDFALGLHLALQHAVLDRLFVEGKH